MTDRRYRRTAKEWIDSVVNAKTAYKAGLVRRKLSSIPSHLRLIDVVNDIVARNFKALINESQIIIILDRHLMIYD
jgi:hypothetical protein